MVEGTLNPVVEFEGRNTTDRRFKTESRKGTIEVSKRKGDYKMEMTLGKKDGGTQKSERYDTG